MRFEIVSFLSNLALLRRRYGLRFPMLGAETIASHTELEVDEVKAALREATEEDRAMFAKWGLVIEGCKLVDACVKEKEPADPGAPPVAGEPVVKRKRGRPRKTPVAMGERSSTSLAGEAA